MTRIALLSDSHIPERASEIPDSFRSHIRQADRVVHAGDFTSPETLATVESHADGDFTGVYGNMDPRNLDLPAVATLDVENVTFVITHGTGSPHGYEERIAGIVRKEAGEDAVGIAGHTHEVLDTTVDGTRLLNPGSCTGAAPASRITMMTLDVDGTAFDVTVHEV